jgi:hypothetical protein
MNGQAVKDFILDSNTTFEQKQAMVVLIQQRIGTKVDGNSLPPKTAF